MRTAPSRPGSRGTAAPPAALARALQGLAGEFRLIYADHRGRGRSDKPHDVEAYALPLQAAGAVAVLDELRHRTRARRRQALWRQARLRTCRARARAPALVRFRRTAALRRRSRRPSRARRPRPPRDDPRGRGERFVEALERYWGVRFPDTDRSAYLAQDGVAVAAAAEAMFSHGPIARDLRKWRVPCLIFIGAGDTDFLEQARRAAEEIPNAEFIALDELDHYGAHFEAERVIPAMLRTLLRTG